MGEQGNYLRDQFLQFCMLKVNSLWDKHESHTERAIVEFPKGWSGLKNAMDFENHFETMWQKALEVAGVLQARDVWFGCKSRWLHIVRALAPGFVTTVIIKPLLIFRMKHIRISNLKQVWQGSARAWYKDCYDGASEGRWNFAEYCGRTSGLILVYLWKYIYLYMCLIYCI